MGKFWEGATIHQGLVPQMVLLETHVHVMQKWHLCETCIILAALIDLESMGQI